MNMANDVAQMRLQFPNALQRNESKVAPFNPGPTGPRFHRKLGLGQAKLETAANGPEQGISDLEILERRLRRLKYLKRTSPNLIPYLDSMSPRAEEAKASPGDLQSREASPQRTPVTAPSKLNLIVKPQRINNFKTNLTATLQRMQVLPKHELV